MRLDQFDKLDHNIRNVVDYIFNLKIENRQLKKEVEKLQTKLNEISEKGIDSLGNKNEIYSRGDSLTDNKKEEAVSQLDKVLDKMKNLSKGVEFK